MRLPQVKVDWTEARLAKLKHMARLGYTSYEISAAIGVSRAAVCGKCWRLGIKLRGKPLNGVNKCLALAA
jgi:hypothetical protein